MWSAASMAFLYPRRTRDRRVFLSLGRSVCGLFFVRTLHSRRAATMPFRYQNPTISMSEMGRKRTWRDQIAMSVITPKADIPRRSLQVRFGSCVDGSALARVIFTSAALVGAAMCSAFECGSHTAGHNALRGSGPDH